MVCDVVVKAANACVKLERQTVGIGVAKSCAVGKPSGRHGVCGRVSTQSAHLFLKGALRGHILLDQTVPSKRRHGDGRKEYAVVTVLMREARAVLVVVAGLHALKVTHAGEEG